tara:strand:- start:1 stop:123 length:123 start_codon:yes stop_codon:yes gene_type:complete
VKTNAKGNIVGNGAGTLMTGDKIIKGVFGNGYLKTADDKS